MPEKAAASGFTLEVPVDASAISADDLIGQVLKVVVRPCEGELLSETVKLRADGTGSVRFSFAKRPGAMQVLIGPERAEDAELAASQTITTSVSASAWADKRQVVAAPLRVSPYYWFWWLRWCREFTIRGRVVCAVFSTIAAISSAAEMLVIVSQTSLSQPRISQPRRFASAPTTTITSAPTTQRFH